MKKFFDHLITALALSLGIPTLLILISWNAVPGSGLYPVKSVLEDVALAATSQTPLASRLSLEFTDRRNDEATTLLVDEGSTAGYDLLVAEAKQTQNLVLSKDDAKTAFELVEKIDQYQSEIEYTKTQVVGPTQVTQPSKSGSVLVAEPVDQTKASSGQPVRLPEPEIVATGQQEVTVTKPVTIVIKEETVDEVVEELDRTYAELEKIKRDVEIRVPESDKSGDFEAKDTKKQEKEREELKEKLEKRFEKSEDNDRKDEKDGSKEND